MPYIITLISLRQALTPNRLRGWVTASARVVAVTRRVGALLFDALAERLGLRPALSTAAVGMLVPLVWLALSSVFSLHEQPVAAEPGRAVV